MLERVFKLRENHTNAKTEIMAGITTFMTMAYILAVNPSILSATGMDANAILIATSLSAFIGTALMVLLNLITGKAREKKISPLMYVLTVLFILKYVLL